MQDELSELLKSILDYSNGRLVAIPEFPFPETFENKKNLFCNAVERKVIDNAEAILQLVEKEKGLIAYSVCRSLFELYLSTRLVLEIDKDVCLDCFYLFSDFQTYQKLKKIGVHNIQDNDDKQEYQEVLNMHEEKDVKRRYEEAIRDLKPEFKAKYPESGFTPSKNDGWWLGLAPSQLSEIFGGDVRGLYLKKYWDFSNMSHPSPFGILQYVANDRGPNHTWEISSLVFAIHISLWLFLLLSFETEEAIELYSKKMDSLSEIVKNHLEPQE